MASLLIEMTVLGQHLATGTGFVVNHRGTPYLISNRHCLSGRQGGAADAPMSKTGATPDRVSIWHNDKKGLLNWVQVTEALLDEDERPRWLEHPVHGKNVDVVALPLEYLNDVELYPHTLTDAPLDIQLAPSQDLFVIGFPYGLTGGGLLGIWTRGTVASEPEVDIDELPRFLIDSRTRTGQSGSPVVAFNRGGAMAMADGSVSLGTSGEWLVGIYSGRVHPESDLGIVWKRQAILDVLERGVRPISN